MLLTCVIIVHVALINGEISSITGMPLYKWFMIKFSIPLGFYHLAENV